MRTQPSDADRLVERFARLGPQRRALLLALAPFEDDDGRFDRLLWVTGFDSDDPRTIVEVKAVTALYEGIVNHLLEILFAAARNELQHASPGVEPGQVFEDVQLLLRTIGGFIDSCIAWLERHGVPLTH
jgi:hypothetical protein